MDPLAERLKNTSWWTILKELPYDGGPSSTRFVYLATFFVSSLGYILITSAFAIVYVVDKSHPAGAGILAVLTLMLGTLTGISANSQNVRHQLSAQLSSSTPIETQSTPGSGSTSSEV